MKDRLERLLLTTGDIALRRRAKWIIENLNPKKGQCILDLGCGDGFYLHLLSNLDIELVLYGVDYDRNALNSAQKNLYFKAVNFKRADLREKLPFPDNYFDGIVMSEVMEHLPDDVRCMKEVRRVLKKGGKVVISVPHTNYPFLWDPINWILEKFFNFHIKNGFWAGIWNQHIRLYSTRSLQFALKESGFINIKISKLTHYCLPFNHHLINLGARVLNNKSTPASFKKNISKFSQLNQNDNNNLYWIIFKIDALNDKWNGKGDAVSIVASAIK